MQPAISPATLSRELQQAADAIRDTHPDLSDLLCRADDFVTQTEARDRQVAAKLRALTEQAATSLRVSEAVMAAAREVRA